MPLLYKSQQRLLDYPYILEIHESSFQDWMLDYSVKDFLAGGKIQMEPEKFGSPKWVNSLYYQVYPTSKTTIQKYQVSGYIYLQDGEDGKMKVIP